MGELHQALRAAQAEFPVITRKRDAAIETKSGGSYHYSYADLGDINEAVDKILWKHGLTLIQKLDNLGGEPALVTELHHDSGESDGGSIPLPSGLTSQALGSAVTYLRRYAKSTILGIVTEPDDDGAAATGKGSEAKGYEGGNEDFDLILSAARFGGNDFLASLAKQIRDRGTLTDKQITSGVRSALKVLEESDPYEEPN